MIAVTCEWGGDISVSPTGDISTVLIQNELQQRIIRRLLTNAGDYIWHLDYGAGLGCYVGEPYSPNNIEANILAQLQHETLIEANPPPTVAIDQGLAGLVASISVTIQYQIIGTQNMNSVSLGVGE
jgi:hypothetical protein